jgi:hypothetical protein
MFKRQQIESPYDESVTVTETFFISGTVAGEILIKNCHTELHKNSTDSLVADFM